MIQFQRLRINGFKSFVDRTELEIGPGLNGVVGPNGCGKSNLVEALRWVMGENSAKRMRGGGMEDVIFNGTAKRPKRNIADVSLLLDNSTRSAPAAYNSSDELEVTRRIERDHGSNYKINGKNVRARDVQMLFADTVTGANSPAMVSQGRITQIINSKPLERRLVLEESAGISGLFVRRHEAELRLRAADTNLARIEDLLGSMEGRLNALKRQAKQATRYRNVSTQIRQMEILIAYVEWQTLNERMSGTKAKFEEFESQVAERLSVVTALTKTQTTQAQDLPALRQKEAELAAALQKQKIELQRIEDESARLGQILSETAEQLEQAKHDFEHEQKTLTESSELLEKLEQEHKVIAEEQKAEDGKLEAKDEARTKLEEQVDTLEAQYNALMQGAAEAKARKDALEQRIATNTSRLNTLVDRESIAKTDLEATKDKENPENAALEQTIADLETRIKTMVERIEATRNDLKGQSESIEAARTAKQEAEKRESEFETEISILEEILKADNEETSAPVLHEVKADSGFEKALSRALGDSLMASLEETAQTTWLTKSKNTDFPALPASIEPISPHIKAPKALQAALSQIGLVENDEDGFKLWEDLGPGQALVSKNGTYWRWDGYCVKADAPDRHAQQLEQQNKLAALKAQLPKIEKVAQAARDALEKQLSKQSELEETLESLNAERKTAESDLSDSRKQWSDIRDEQARISSEITRLENLITLTAQDREEVEKSLKQDKTDLQAYEDVADQDKEEQLEEVRSTLLDARKAHTEAVRAYDLYVQQQNTRNARMQAIGDERINLQNRCIRAKERIKELEERIETLTEKHATLKARPDDFADDKANRLSAISELEEQRSAAADKLAEVENEVTETGRALKDAERVLGEARESRAGSQALLSSLIEQQEALRESIEEQFQMAPEALPEHSAIDMDKDFGDLESLKGKKEKLVRERDGIGAVNLRAEEEALELEKEVGGMLHERNDLVQAIDELRTGIQKINNEARERLLVAFDHVNAHFQNLFVRLFGGGKAHLALIESDDPLNSGLEIFAQPPGKTLQSLSLLSGGEQTMASIALIFAMFLTNPSPICVLDEIDAPLDDANVDRVCDLLEEIAERGETRFLVITHHRLTMARMDRLYGVTMAEKGVSQLVSVDLQQSFEFIEEAA
ncbi:MAG: chromosome segregation protein SMC [Alphaproteobacteria bacterium]|nr:chromosome segregation protein SMC [Alphaproteobacteria bacterium]